MVGNINIVLSNVVHHAVCLARSQKKENLQFVFLLHFTYHLQYITFIQSVRELSMLTCKEKKKIKHHIIFWKHSREEQYANKAEGIGLGFPAGTPNPLDKHSSGPDQILTRNRQFYDQDLITIVRIRKFYQKLMGVSWQVLIAIFRTWSPYQDLIRFRSSIDRFVIRNLSMCQDLIRSWLGLEKFVSHTKRMRFPLPPMVM